MVFRATAICLVFFSLIARAQEDSRVPYPADYRNWAVVQTKLIGPQSRLFSVRGGFHHIYANETAVEGYRSGVFPDGSMIVDEGVYAVDNDGILSEGKLRSVEVMHKDQHRYSATGGWGYDRFEADQRTSQTSLEVRIACHSCHAANKDKDYVYTTFRK
jgi:hypothetical protein